MIKRLLPLILSSLLFSNPLDTTQEIVPLDKSFTLDAKSPMFDTNLSYTHVPLLSCQPSLDAVYKVESSTQLKIMPTKDLQSGSTYSCNYKEENFSFKTEALKVLDAHYIQTHKLLRLSFNDHVKKESLRKHLYLTKVDKLSKTKLNYSILESEPKNILLKINESVKEHALVLNIDQALSTPQNSTLTKAFEKQLNNHSVETMLDKKKKAMSIVDKPRMVALPTGEFAIRLFFNDYIEDDAKKSIEVKGIEQIKLSKNYYVNHHLREQENLSDNSYYYTDIISSEFQPNSNYTLTLKKGLQTYQELKKDISYQLKSGDRAKSILFEREKQYLSNIGELGFSSVNVESATLIVERLLDENLRYFMNFNRADISKTSSYSKEILNKKLTLDNPKNVLTKQKFSMKELHKKLPFGVYKISLHYNDTINGKIKEHSKSKVLFLSDLGISLNLAKEQAFVTVLSLSSGKPIAAANIELYGENNELIATAKSNKDGVAIIEKAHLLKATPKGLIVKTVDDKNFLALNHPINSPYPHEILENKVRFKAHIFFQSQILRPASKINALITIKDRDFISANKLPIKLILKELQGKVIHEKVYHCDEFGLIEFQYQLDKLDKTGQYELSAFIGKERIGKELLKVESFMPPKIENSISTNKTIYTVGEPIELNISSSYLFGAPSSELQGSVQLNTNAIDFEHEAFKAYSFSNRNLKENNINSYLDYHEDFLLDKTGKKSLFLPSKIIQNVPSILEALINVTVMDDTQPLSSYKKIKIYPYKHMVGLHLQKSSFEKGQKLEGKAVLIDPLTNKPIKRKLYAVIKRISWHYNSNDGNYNWEKESSIVENFSINANENFSRNIHENGDYIIEIHDHLGGHSSSAEFHVWWWSYSNISPKNDLKSIEITIEDRLYKKGEYLDVNIKSPILEGQLFLTLESDKVELYKRIELQKGVAKVRLPLKVDIKRGLHLHATVIRPSDNSSKLIPFRAMGYTFIKPNREEHKIEVKINAPNESPSKSSLALNITSSKPAKVLVSIVDKGILQLVKQKKPEIFNYFNDPAKRKLGYYDLYERLMSHISEGKLVSFGAGDILAMRAKHLAPDLGKRVKPFMLWSGIVDVDSNETNLSINIPEFNGKASIVAIAINKNNIGVQEKEIRIKDAIMIKPSYPKYALVGDKMEVPIRIFNTTASPKSLQLTTKLSKNLSFSLNEKNITVPANNSKVITAMLHAHELGEGNITLYATDANMSISKELKLPIYSPYSLSTKTFKGIINKTQTFKVPAEYSDAKVFLTLSDNLIGTLRDDLKYLISYPYGCAEQTSSALSSMHYAKAFLEKDSLVSKSQHFIRQGVKKLQNMQNYHGEFYYWSNGEEVNPYASLYAAQTLLELQRDGTEISQSFVKKIIQMLRHVTQADNYYEATYSSFHRIYAAFILAEHQKLEKSTANMLFEQKIYKKHFLATYYMAAILKMQGEEKEADKLYTASDHELSRYALKPYGNRTGNFESNVRDMLLHFIIKTRYFNKEEKDLVTVQKEFSNLYSTQSKAVALKAISSYLGKPQSSKVDVNISINGKNEHYTQASTITLDKLKSPTITLTPNASAMSYNIELIKHLAKAPKNKFTKKELSIVREFIDAQGNKVNLNDLKQGTKIYSKIQIANYAALKQVVVNQKVPACLSIVNNNIKNNKALFKDKNIDLDYKEIRDDRVLHFVNLKKKEKYDNVLKKHISLQNIGVLYTPFIVSTKGICQLPAVITEAMYDTRIYDYAKEERKIMIK